MSGIGEALVGVINDLANRFLSQLPSVLGALVLILVGWILARLARAATRRGMYLIERIANRWMGSARDSIGHSAVLFSTIIFWVVLLLFVTAATQVLGLPVFADWLNRLVGYVPTLAAGVLIVIAGIVLARFIADLILATATRMVSAQRVALARMAQVAALVTALLVGADQMGIKITWVAVLAVVIVGSGLGAIALTLSLGARTYAANLIGAHYFRQSFQVGQRVRVAGFEGRILEFTAISLVLETAEGRVLLPGRLINEEAVTLIARAPDG